MACVCVCVCAWRACVCARRVRAVRRDDDRVASATRVNRVVRVMRVYVLCGPVVPQVRRGDGGARGRTLQNQTCFMVSGWVGE